MDFYPTHNDLSTLPALERTVRDIYRRLYEEKRGLTEEELAAFRKKVIGDVNDSVSEQIKNEVISYTYISTSPSKDACVALADGPIIYTDAELGKIFTVTLGGNRVLESPTGLTYCGQPVCWVITQDATGGRTLTFGAKFRFGTDIPSLVLSTVGGKQDYLGCIYDLGADKLDVVAFVRGY